MSRIARSLLIWLLLSPLAALAAGSGSGVVGYVPDGDTIHLVDGRRLRLIGINTPEVARKRKAGEEGGEEAARALARLVDQPVRFDYDQEREDRYHRQLVHLYDQQGQLVNEWLLRQGYAFATPHPPNLSHTARYAAAEAAARSERLGIWRLARYRVEPSTGAGQYRGTFRRLRGRVESIRQSRKYHRLTLEGGVVALILRSDEALFRQAGKGVERLEGAQLVVRGWVGRGGDDVIIRLRHPNDIESVTR